MKNKVPINKSNPSSPKTATDLTRRWRWAPLTIMALGLILRLALAWQPFKFQLERGALVDDAFYSLNVARHLALGHGLTFDGIHSTNGFQPLYVFLMVPVFGIYPNDPVAPVYAAMTLLALANLGSGWFLYRIARRRFGETAGIFGLSLFCCSPYIIETSANGLETSLAGLFFLIALEVYLSRMRPAGGSRRDRVLLGLALAALVFTRVDGALLAVALALDFLFRPLPSSPPLVRRLRLIAEFSLFSLLIYAPWMIYNLIVFKSVIPESGAAVHFIAQRFGGWGLDFAVPDFSPGQAPASFYLGHLTYSVGALYRGQVFFPENPLAFLLFLAGNLFSLPALSSWPVMLILLAGGLGLFRFFEREMDALLIFIALLLAAYNFYVFGYWFFFRYFYPIQLCFLLMGSAIFKAGWERVPTRARVYAALSLVLIYAAVFGYTAKKRLSFSTDDNIATYYQVAKSLDKIVSPGARVGVFQAGTIGYFADRTVINLDGVVNPGALQAMQGKNLAAYLEREKISYVVDYALITHALLFPSLHPGDEKRLESLSAANSKIQLYRVKPARP